MKELIQTTQNLKHLWRIVEIQVFYRKYKGRMTACKPTIESEDKVFESYADAEEYFIKRRGRGHWEQTNSRTGEDNWGQAYYEVIDENSAILRWTDSNNYRIFSWRIVDFYMDEEEYENYKDVRRR